MIFEVFSEFERKKNQHVRYPMIGAYCNWEGVPYSYFSVHIKHTCILALVFGGFSVCLLILVCRPTWEFFSYGEVTITGDVLQMLTYIRDSWAFSNGDSFTCNIYCVNPFKWSSPRICDWRTCCERLAVELSLPV